MISLPIRQQRDQLLADDRMWHAKNVFITATYFLNIMSLLVNLLNQCNY